MLILIPMCLHILIQKVNVMQFFVLLCRSVRSRIRRESTSRRTPLQLGLLKPSETCQSECCWINCSLDARRDPLRRAHARLVDSFALFHALPPGSFLSTWSTVHPTTSPTPHWRRSWSVTLSSIRSRTAKRSTCWDATRRPDRNVALSSTGSTTAPRATCWSRTCKVLENWGHQIVTNFHANIRVQKWF